MLDSNVFANLKVVEEARRFVALRVDMSNETPPVAKKYGVAALPAVLFFDSQGRELRDLHLKQVEVSPERFVETLKKISG